MKAAGATGAVAAGGFGIAAMTGGAAATTSSGFSADDPGKVTTDDGEITAVYIEPSGEVEWDGFDQAVETVEVRIDSKIEGDDGWERQYADTFGVDGGTDGSWSYDDCGRITLYDGDDRIDEFSSDADGKQDETTVEVRATVLLRNDDGNLAQPTDAAELSDAASFGVTVENRTATASGSGTADPGVEADES